MFDVLPIEIIEMIFSYLSLKDITNALSCSKQAGFSFLNKRIWEVNLKKDFSFAILPHDNGKLIYQQLLNERTRLHDVVVMTLFLAKLIPEKDYIIFNSKTSDEIIAYANNKSKPRHWTQFKNDLPTDDEIQIYDLTDDRYENFSNLFNRVFAGIFSYQGQINKSVIYLHELLEMANPLELTTLIDFLNQNKPYQSLDANLSDLIIKFKNESPFTACFLELINRKLLTYHPLSLTKKNTALDAMTEQDIRSALSSVEEIGLIFKLIVMWIVKLNLTKLFNILLDKQPLLINNFSNQFHSLLHLAVQMANPTMVEELLKRNAEVNANQFFVFEKRSNFIYNPDAFSESPLFVAVYFFDLMEKCDTFSKADDAKKVIQILLEYDADPTQPCRLEGEYLCSMSKDSVKDVNDTPINHCLGYSNNHFFAKEPWLRKYMDEILVIIKEVQPLKEKKSSQKLSFN